MSLNYVVAWIDQTEAHVIHFNPKGDESQVTTIKSTYVHHKAGVDSGENPAETIHYFDEVAAAVADAKEILIVGPGQEKLALMKHFTKAQPAVAEKVVSVETVDHPNDATLLTFARKHFDSAGSRAA